MKSITLDDGIEYIIYDTETIDNIEYTLFININDDKDVCFRKTITENNEKFYIGLDNEKLKNPAILNRAHTRGSPPPWNY